MDLDQLRKYFGDSTDIGYMEAHHSRFCATKGLATRRWKWEKADILDVGAHWLHQSALYALDGHHVTAADISSVLDNQMVQNVASKLDIDLLSYEDLSVESVFDRLKDDSIDVILFCEILEHITFNPVGMWKAFYRVLRPGGRIILTTPNCYSGVNIVFPLIRFLSGWGSGIPVTEILEKNTYSPHWKEFSRKELKKYFELLSADFNTRNQCYFSYVLKTNHLNWKGKLAYDRKDLVPFLRKGIYQEVDLPHKHVGITMEPSW
jgi:2-polyprenyl-3-methyl-5-hydroxy-6-metoxy-1,4-benzoquinol methylase